MTRVTTESREDIEETITTLQATCTEETEGICELPPEAARSTDSEKETEMAGPGTVIERQAANGDAVAAFGNGVSTLLVVVRQGAEDTKAERRAQEDAAIDADDILTQAEEANAPDPVG